VRFAQGPRGQLMVGGDARRTPACPAFHEGALAVSAPLIQGVFLGLPSDRRAQKELRTGACVGGMVDVLWERGDFPPGSMNLEGSVRSACQKG